MLIPLTTIACGMLILCTVCCSWDTSTGWRYWNTTDEEPQLQWSAVYPWHFKLNGKQGCGASFGRGRYFGRDQSQLCFKWEPFGAYKLTYHKYLFCMAVCIRFNVCPPVWPLFEILPRVWICEHCSCTRFVYVMRLMAVWTFKRRIYISWEAIQLGLCQILHSLFKHFRSMILGALVQKMYFCLIAVKSNGKKKKNGSLFYTCWWFMILLVWLATIIYLFSVSDSGI